MSFEGGDFESWLDQGLGQALGTQRGPSPLPAQASYHAAYLSGGVGLSSFGSTVVAALTSKVAVGGATAALIVGGGTAAAAAAGSGSLDPANWGQFISQTVVPTCKEQAASAGLHGIGQCVSSIARLHGQEVASEARQHGAGAAGQHGRSDQAPGHQQATEGRRNGDQNGGKPTGNPGQGNKPANPGGQGQGNGNSGAHGAPAKH